MEKIKNFIKKFVPLSIAKFNLGLKKIMDEIHLNRKETVKVLNMVKQERKQIEKIQKALLKQQETLSKREEALSRQQEALSRQQENISQNLNLFKEQQEERVTVIRKKLNALSNSFHKEMGDCNKEIYNLKRIEHENEWGMIFNNTITGSVWLLDQSFSLGRWAIGYPCAYILYRVLHEIQPKKIIELGLGQSTKIIAQYVLAHEGIEHFVVEHDEKWIDFFKRNYELSNQTEIVKCDWKFSDYNEVSGIREYDGFYERFLDKKFGLIFIDGPLGGDMPEFSRIDILRLLPGCLEDSFVMILDDCNRSGEMNTFHKMQEILENEGIEYQTGNYSGEKDARIICSVDFSFLCTL